MHDVAAELGTTTSAVSQGIAALAREVGTPLVEPDGRRVRLTPAGHRLAEHAVTILASVEAARLDLDPAAEPAGVVRVAGFATAIRRSLLPAMDDLAHTHPDIEVRVLEYEPQEALDLLARDDIDLALTYDYDLAPVSWRTDHEVVDLWSVDWGLGVSARETRAPFASYADRDWIVNSRNTADEEVLRTLASMAGFTPRVVHRIDALELVDDLIVAGRGIRLQPGPGDVGDREQTGGVRVGARTCGLRGVDAHAPARAAVGGVLEGDRVPRRTATGEEVHHQRVVGHGAEDPADQPGRLRRLEDVADQLLELGDGGVGRPDLLGEPDGAQLLAPPARDVAEQPVALVDVDPVAVLALDHPADHVVGPLLDERPAPAPHRGPAVAEDRLDLDRAVVRRRAHPPALRVAPHGAVQGPRGERVELLVGVAQG